MRKATKKKLLYVTLFVIILIIILHPELQGVRPYVYMAKKDVLNSLHEELAKNFTSTEVSICDYYDIINDDSSLTPNVVIEEDLDDTNNIKDGGEYAPAHCRPKFSTAVIVPYRDRAEELRGFLVYMHTFLRHQKIHYRLYVIEQVDTLPFNRAKLLNIGAVAAMKAGFPCLVLHDVDLLPLRPANLYACTKQPRHLSSSGNKFRYVLPYLNLFSGAVSLLSKQFKDINGMSNEYFGWGGEDDDLVLRLEAHNLKLCRYAPEISQYYLEDHALPYPGEKNKKLLETAKERIKTDGLSNLKYSEVATVMHPLFTHIMVDL